MLNLSSYYGVPVIVSARTMVDQGGDPEAPHAEWHLRITEEEEKEKEEKEKSGLFFKI